MRPVLTHKALAIEFENLPEDNKLAMVTMYGGKARALSAYIATTRGAYGLAYNETDKEKEGKE